MRGNNNIFIFAKENTIVLLLLETFKNFMNQKIAELKSNLKTDERNDPRDELNFFEESCNVNDIFNINDRYKILTAVWPAKDIRNYWAITEGKNKCY